MDRVSVSGSGDLNVSVGKRKGAIGGKTEDVNEGLKFHRSCVIEEELALEEDLCVPLDRRERRVRKL